MRLVVAGWAICVLLAGCQANGGESKPPSVAPVTAEPSATATGEPSASEAATSPSPSEAPTGFPMALQPDMVVTTTVENLTLRGSAGTSGERLGLLALGTTAFVVDGPAVVDGVPWYLIAGMGLPYASGCATLPPDAPISCPAFVGWAAGTNQAGAPWIEGRQPGPCPQPTIESISERGATWRLVCWADQEITFDAWWPGPSQVEGDCPPLEDPGGFLLCEYVNPNWLSASSDEGFIQRLSLSIDPASGVEMPDGGQPVRVTGRFDHPAADLCASLNADAGPQLLVLQCRLRFVPSSVEPLRS